ncbi:MAG: crotonase/enoyl-CoA hydratase family protein [Ktedonobacterales bacterium]
MAENVRYEQEGPVVTITLTRPEVHNCVDGATAAALHAAWTRFRDDDAALVAILTGAGASFSSGADLKAAHTLGPQGDALDPAFVFSGAGYLGFTRLTDIFKPTIAAVAGHCLAGGLEMACWCDIRLAAEDAVFGCAERRWGVPLVDGGTQRLPRILGWGRGLDLILTGRTLDAAQALAWGLVSEVVPRDELLPRARALAARIARYPQGALRTDKQAAVRGWGLPLEEALRVECQLGMPHITSAEMAEGLRRFRERELES